MTELSVTPWLLTPAEVMAMGCCRPRSPFMPCTSHLSAASINLWRKKYRCAASQVERRAVAVELTIVYPNMCNTAAQAILPVSERLLAGLHTRSTSSFTLLQISVVCS